MANQNPFLWWLPSTPTEAGDRPSAPALPDVHAKPGHLIRRAQQIAVAIFLEECTAFDLTPVQYAALIAIRDNPAIDATRISGLIGFDRTTVSGVMERLESKGWIARKANAADRRIKIVDITASGKKVLKEIEPMVQRAQERMLQPLDRAEQEMLIVLLARVVEHNNETSRAPQRPLDSASED